MNNRSSGVRLTLVAVALAALTACVGDDADPASTEAQQPSQSAQSSSVAQPLRPGVFGLELSAGPIARLGEDYQAPVSVSSGLAPYRFEITAGTIPPGLAFDRDTGVFQGRPSQLGRFEVTVKVTDARGVSTTGPFRLTVIEADAPLVANPNRAAYQAAGRSISTGVLGNSVRLSATTTLGGANRVDAPLPGLLGLMGTIPEGGWVKANLNQFADVWTPDALRNWDKNSGGIRSPAGIIGAWSGFAWDPNRGDLILYGGGHATYGGNDVYRWHGTTRVWERASLPSEITQDALNNYIAIDGPDNAPSAAHTYDNSVFLPILDRFLTFGGAAYNNGDAYLRDNGAGVSRYTGPYVWDPSKGDPNKVGGTTGSHVKRVAPYPDVVGGQMWQNRDIKVNLATTPNLPSSHVSGCTGYAVEGGKDVVYVGARTGGGVADHLFRYVINDVNNPSADTWTKIGGYWDGPQTETVCAFDPVQKLFVRLGNKTRPFMYWNVNTPSASANFEVALSFTEVSGDLTARLNAGTLDIRNCGFDLDPVRRNYVLWCGGTDVWTLKPPATVGSTGWILQKQVVPTGSAPTTALGSGILGKWKYIPNLDAFMGLQDSTAGNVWIYKPYGWQSPGSGTTNVPPSVTLAAPVGGQTFTAGTAVNIQAAASDSDGAVSMVEFFDGATKIGSVGQAPWQISWSGFAVGQHSITAVATDNLGASTASASVTITITAVNQAPSVTLTSPANAQIFVQGQSITLAASPLDPEGQIASVQFLDGATVLTTLHAAPWQFVVANAAVGNHSYSAIVADGAGNTGTSASVSIQVNPGGSGALTAILQDGLNGYSGTRDAYIYSYWPTYNLGTLATMVEQGGYSIPLVRFAIFNREGGPVPDNAVVTSAKLALYKASYYTTTFAASRLLCDWQETEVTWRLCRAGTAWVAVGASSVDADFVSAADGTGSVGWNPGSWLEIDVTSGLAAMQAGAVNYGWRIRRTDGDNVNGKGFNTRNFTTDTSLRPKLTVSYTVN
jgi:hypothetical protein